MTPEANQDEIRYADDVCPFHRSAGAHREGREPAHGVVIARAVEANARYLRGSPTMSRQMTTMASPEVPRQRADTDEVLLE